MSNIIVMAFSPRNIIGCFLKNSLQRGGHGRQTPLSLRPCVAFLSRSSKKRTPDRRLRKLGFQVRVNKITARERVIGNNITAVMVEDPCVPYQSYFALLDKCFIL